MRSLLLHHFTVTHSVKTTGLCAVNVVWADLNYCHNHCWCKNTRCTRAVLWPEADIQELLPPTPKTTRPRFARCQLAASHRAFPFLSDPPSWPLCDYQQLLKKHKSTWTCSGAPTPTALTCLDHINPLSCRLPVPGHCRDPKNKEDIQVIVPFVGTISPDCIIST